MPDADAAALAARAVELGGELPGEPGATGTVVLVLPGLALPGLGGDPHVALRYVDGRPADVEVAAGPVPGADLTLTLPAEEAAAVADGRLPPSVAFMQGRLKTAGDNRLLLAVLAGTATPVFERWRQALVTAS